MNMTLTTIKTVPIGGGSDRQELSWERRTDRDGLRREMQRISYYKRPSWVRSVWWSARDRGDHAIEIAALDLAVELGISWRG